MKLTQEQAIALLKKVGVQDAEIVETEDLSDFDQSAALTAIDESRKPIISQKLDGESREEIKSQVMGELVGRIHGQLSKTFGASRSQLDKTEKLEDAISLAKAHYSSQFDGEKAEMDKKYNELVQQYNADKENLSKDWESKYNTLKNTVDEKEMVEIMLGKLKDAPITWDKTLAAKEVLSHAKSKYDLAIKDGDIVYYEKGSERVALNEAKNEHVKHMDIAKEHLSARNGWATDNRAATPKGVGQNQQPPKNNFSHLMEQSTDKLERSKQMILERQQQQYEG